MALFPAFVVAAVAYLIGSIPFSFLVARGFGVSDVRRVGSGNVGATNVARNAGKGAGVLALALDVGKGFAATSLASSLASGDARLPALAAALAVVGHMFPLWLRFEGGKGVATGLGAFLPLSPLAAILALVAFAATVAVTRYVSVGSVVGALTLAAVAFFSSGAAVAVAAATTALLIVGAHHSNLRRILIGSEHRAGRLTRGGAP
jgi:glycerol-3-phosphate acyltransferase PlsY